MAIEVQFTIFALGRGLSTVEAETHKFLDSVDALNKADYDSSKFENFVAQTSHLTARYMTLLADILEEAIIEESVEHQATAHRIEVMLQHVLNLLHRWKKSDIVRMNAAKNVPIFNHSVYSWVEFRDSFEKHVMSNVDLNDDQKKKILLSKLNRANGFYKASMSLLQLWTPICDKFNKFLLQLNMNNIYAVRNLRRSFTDDELQKFHETIQTNVDGLYSAGFKVDSTSDLLIGRIVKRKLSSDIRNVMEKSDIVFGWTNIKLMLEEISSYLKKMPGRAETDCRHITPKTEETSASNDLKVTNKANRWSCFECGKNHMLRFCPTFMALGISDRWDTVEKSRICSRCFSLSHTAEKCYKITCYICKKGHNTLLHPGDTRCS